MTMKFMNRIARPSSVLLLSCAYACVCLSSVNCSTLRKPMHKSMQKMAVALNIIEHSEAKPPPRDAPELYRKSLAFLEERKFSEALAGLDEFLMNEPTTSWTQAARLNSGRALEGLERYSEAGERYRAVIQATGSAPKLQAMALYRLSFCHEAAGDDQQVVATLNDVLKREKHLPIEIGRAELPARLAAAYARVGNFDLAVEFYKKAENAIVRLRQDASLKELPEWLPRTLFYMGNMSLRKVSWDDFETAMRPLARGQIYLLQSAELANDPWSERAATELMSIYHNLWITIETAPLDADMDPLLARRAVQKRQWGRAILLQDSLTELKARAMPEGKTAKMGEPARKILGFADDLEKRIQTMLMERPAGEGLTDEALQRQQRVRGRVLSPDDSLERQFLRSGRQTPTLRPKSLPKKPSAKHAPAPTPVQAPALEPAPPPAVAPSAEPESRQTTEETELKSIEKNVESRDPNL